MVTASSDNLDGRPSIPDSMCQPDAIHCARHIHVSEDHRNIASSFQDLDSLICISRFDNAKPSLLDHRYGVGPNQIFVLDTSTRDFESADVILTFAIPPPLSKLCTG